MSNIRELRDTVGSGNLLAANGLPGLDGVENRLRDALGARLGPGSELSAAELEEVATLDKALFPKTLELAPETTETIRVLCALSRCQLRPAREIRSHRAFIGPLIVFLKRLSWPLIRFHLKDTFDSMDLFHRKLIYAHARQVFEIEQMKKNLPILP